MNFDTINLGSEWWIHFMAFRILDSTLVFALVGTVWLLARQRVSAQFGYLLFLLILAKLTVPSWFSIPELISSYFPGKELAGSDPSIGWLDWNFGTGSPGGYDAATNADNANPNRNMVLDSDSALTLPSVLMFVWFAIVTVFTIRMAVVIRNSCRMIQNSKRIVDRQRLIALQQLQEIAGIKRPVRWVHGDWVKTPVAFGIVHPAIAIPANLFEKFSSNQIRWILLHELAHIKRGDAIVAYIQQIVQILFFMHPVVWWANIIIDQQREYACDDAALAGSQSSPVECGEGFLGVVMQSNGLPAFLPATLGLINYKTMIRRRLMRILDEKHTTNFNLSRRESLLLLASTPAILLMGGKTAAAQEGEWIKVEDISVDIPSHRCMQGMVYDSAKEVILLHGGYRNSNLNDTWEWNVNTKTWTHVSNEGPYCSYQGMAYDPVRKVSVLSGNLTGNCETWEWDGLLWEKKTEEDYLMSPAMAYYPERNSIIRHGGAIEWQGTVIKVTSKTWEWDGNQWIPLPDGPILGDHKMVYDPGRKKLVVFGGFKGTDTYSNETWEFDGVTWTKVAETGPAARQAFDMVYDSDRGVMVLVGGGMTTYSGHEANIQFYDMWQWDGTEWTRINAEFPTKHSIWFKMVYDPKNNQIVMFEGLDMSVSDWPPDLNSWLFRFRSQSSGIPFRLWSMY